MFHSFLYVYQRVRWGNPQTKEKHNVCITIEVPISRTPQCQPRINERLGCVIPSS